MILITSIELPEFVRTRATFLLAVDVMELSDERVMYAGTFYSGQDFVF